MKPKGVTAQMKALNESFLMEVFTLLQNRVHVFANFMFILTEKHGGERVKGHEKWITAAIITLLLLVDRIQCLNLVTTGG